LALIQEGDKVTIRSLYKLLVLVLTLALRLDAQAPALAFVDVAVVPMDKEQILSHQTVVVLDGRIVQVGPAGSVKVPKDARRIDGRGKFLMPGLADMHVHLIRSPLPGAQPANSKTTRPASPSSTNAEENRALGLLFVANGITSVRNMWGDPAIDSFAKEVEAGHVLGPHVYSTGPVTDGAPPMWEGSRSVATAEAAEQAVLSDKQAGYVAIKVYEWLSKDAYYAIVNAARREGLPVVGHIPQSITLKEAIAARQYSIEHLSGFLEALQAEGSSTPARSYSQALQLADMSKMPALVEQIKAQDIWNCPTLVLHGQVRTDAEWLDERSFLPSALMERYAKMYPDLAKPAQNSDFPAKEKATYLAIVAALHRGGAHLLLGTDSVKPGTLPGFSLHEELENFVAAGMTPYEAIRAGTADAAIFLHQESEFGVIEVDRRADLLLLNANPLNDVRNTSNRVGVTVNGRWFPEEQLRQQLNDLRATYKH
jgi:imidazolonepropionase-like amidohydrolase